MGRPRTKVRNEPLIPLGEAARLLALTPASLRGMVRRGSIPHIRDGRHTCFTRTQLVLWQRAHTMVTFMDTASQHESRRRPEIVERVEALQKMFDIVAGQDDLNLIHSTAECGSRHAAELAVLLREES